MGTFLIFGSVVGACLGLLHAGRVYRQIAAERLPAQPSGKALYYAVWTLALWTLFGAYVLAFWLLGVIASAGTSRLSSPFWTARRLWKT